MKRRGNVLKYYIIRVVLFSLLPENIEHLLMKVKLKVSLACRSYKTKASLL